MNNNLTTLEAFTLHDNQLQASIYDLSYTLPKDWWLHQIQYNRPADSKEKIRITYPPSQTPINLNCENFKKYQKKKSRVNIYHN